MNKNLDVEINKLYENFISDSDVKKLIDKRADLSQIYFKFLK